MASYSGRAYRSPVPHTALCWTTSQKKRLRVELFSGGTSADMLYRYGCIESYAGVEIQREGRDLGHGGVLFWPAFKESSHTQREASP